jgi:hypothetical protein
MKASNEGGRPPHQATKDTTTLARAIVLESDSTQRSAICRLDLTKTLPELWQIQIQGDGPKVVEVKHTIEALPALGDSSPTDPESVAEAQLKRWVELLELLRSKGFGVESLPESDHRLNLTVDLTSGRSLSSFDALHEFATPGEELARELSAAIAKAFTAPAAALAHQINEAVSQKDLASAVAAVKDAKEKGTFALFPLSSELLEALCAVEVSELGLEDRRFLYEVRAAVASQLGSWKVAGDEADALLAGYKQDMGPRKSPTSV